MTDTTATLTVNPSPFEGEADIAFVEVRCAHGCSGTPLRAGEDTALVVRMLLGFHDHEGREQGCSCTLVLWERYGRRGDA